MRVAHYIPPLIRDTIPPVHAVFDTETRLKVHAGIGEQRWVCGAWTTVRRTKGEKWSIGVVRNSESPQELWETICALAKPHQRLVVWAHNLPFDLRVSEALRWLPRLGFELDGIVLERTAAWASFTSKHGSLLCCDLLSWLPVSLDVIARDMGRRRVPFAYAASDDNELEGRCEEDVDLTADAVCTLLEWLQDNQVGPFRPTGSGQSHACWRRRFMTCKVLAHDDVELLMIERESMWAGRCEAWRHGRVGSDGLHEWDLNLAYCRIAAECDVPTKFRHRTGELDLSRFITYVNMYTILAEVEIWTDQPVVPCLLGDRIIWPTGHFVTTLWDPEVTLALGHCTSVRIRRTWMYSKAPALEDMAAWILGHLTSPDVDVPPPMRRLLKHWARTIVGRMALRYRMWEDWGDSPDLDLRLGLLCEMDGTSTTDILRIGRRIMSLAELAEADSSAPQVTGWVMSEARRRLWQVIQEAGPAHVLYMDTDSVLVDDIGHSNLYRAVAAGRLPNLIDKATWSHGLIHGPRNLELERDRRLAGVPIRAERTGELEFQGEVWRSLKASLARAELDHVAVLPRSFKVRSADPRRKRQKDGTTVPFKLEHNEII